MMNIIPGEPVPPGFEDEVNRIAEIQPAIDQYKGNALIGLEYSLELHEEDDRRREPTYYCVLCDKRGDPRTIMQHWTSFNHRQKYMEKHYATAMRECNPVKYKPNSSHIMISIIQRLAEAIEDHHGRMSPIVYNTDDFRRMKSKIMNDIHAGFHYDERSGPNFVNVIDRTLWESPAGHAAKKMEQTLKITLKAPKRANTENGGHRDGLDEISSDSDGSPTGGGESGKKAKKREQSPAYRVVPRVHRSPPYDDAMGMAVVEKKKLPTPKELSLQASHIAQERYKWEKYRCMLDIQLKQMEKIQLDYEKSPEKHPVYSEEWKKFWNRRNKELQTEKKLDPSKYDYKPEWIIYWTKRVKDIYTAEIEQKKQEIKKKLGLPPDGEEEKLETLKEKYKVQVPRTSNGSFGSGTATGVNGRMEEPSKSSRRDKVAADVIDISDDDDFVDLDSPRRRRRRRSSPSRSRSRSLSRSRTTYAGGNKRARSNSMSSISDEYDRYPAGHHSATNHRHSRNRGYGESSVEYYSNGMPYSRSRHHNGAALSSYRVMDSHQYPKYEHSPTPHSKSADEPEMDEGPLTVVAVLRLLTALEDHLGSLGPKVVDLLGKALALEKVKANSADDLLLNDDHCVFFETIKEKLKGLLIADVLDEPQKVRAVKKAIKNIATVVHQVTTRDIEAEAAKADGTSHSDDAAINDKKLSKKRKSVGKSVKDLPFDRQLVSTKLAAALVLQGRDDVSTDDMDKLIFMLLLLVKLSKENGRSIHCTDLLGELGIPAPDKLVNTGSTALAALTSLTPNIVEELLEQDVSPPVPEVEEEISSSNDKAESEKDGGGSQKDASIMSQSNNSVLESLTDSDLQTLLQNFKHLSTEEQHHLIAHLKKLETTDPARVETLRKFVEVGDMVNDAPAATTTATSTVTGAVSISNGKGKTRAPFSPLDNSNHQSSAVAKSRNNGNSFVDDDAERRRSGGINISNPNKFSLGDEEDEDEDDDYNFEDVFKAASSNVKRLAEQKDHTKSAQKDDSKSKQMASSAKTASDLIVPIASSPNALTFNPAGLKLTSDTQNLIANIMGTLTQNNNQTVAGSAASLGSASGVVSKAVALGVMPQPVPAPPAGQQHVATTAAVSMPAYYNAHQQQHQPHQQQHQPQQQHQHQQQQQQHQQHQYQNYNHQQYAYYNALGGAAYGNHTNNAAAYGAAGTGGYAAQPWMNGQPMQQQYAGMPQYMQQQQQMGYNMYGGGGSAPTGGGTRSGH